MKKTARTTKARASRSAAPHCSACRWWRQDAKNREIGICHDAIKRARMVVPFAVNLSESMIFAWGGKDCPCYKPNPAVTVPPLVADKVDELVGRPNDLSEMKTGD